MAIKNIKHKGYLFGRGLFMASLLCFVFKAQAQESVVEQEISSKLTKEFVPTYIEYTPLDSQRLPSVKLGELKDRKLIFYDDFTDNRHCWSSYSTASDSLLNTCTGFKNNKVCYTKPGKYIDAYTNMESGKKVLFAYTPNIKLKYSNNVPIPLAKNYVVTFNPLSVKQVSKLPSFYYEGYTEHTVRVQNTLEDKDIIIEANIETAIGSWGLMFGNLSSSDASYYFKLNPNNTYELKAIYQGDRSQPMTLIKGDLEIPFANIKQVKIELDYQGDNSYRINFGVNDTRVGHMNVSKLKLKPTDVGFRLDHTSIDGNNILIAQELAVYEKVKPTYLEESVNFSGEWKGALYRGKKPLYNVEMMLTENTSGSINGSITFQHVKYGSTVISKEFKAVRHKHIINFEDRTASISGIYNQVVRYSILQMGHFEVIDPDSLVMQSFVTNNLHVLGEFDHDFDINSNRIYLSRVEKTIDNNGINIDPNNDNPLVEVSILFKPNSPEMSENRENKENLDALARSLHRYLGKNPNKVILIHGHTDVGYEQMYSFVRANTIKGELMNRGISAFIFCIGHGHSNRVSERGDPRNRRVEVEVLGIDSASYENESIIMTKGARALFIKSLPEEFEFQADFKQHSGKHAIVFENASGGVYKFEIPNTAGGERQSLRIIKREDPEEGMMIEYWLDGVRFRRETGNNFVSMGFESMEGVIEIENINIFAPK